MEYARNFMEYLNQKRNIPFEVHAFSSAEMFLEFAKNNETEILLISDKAMKEEIRRYPIRQIVILSEGVHSPVHADALLVTTAVWHCMVSTD